MVEVKRELHSLGEVFGGSAEATDPEVQARVRRVVAAHAHSAEDCRLLLDALGLLPKSAGPPALSG